MTVKVTGAKSIIKNLDRATRIIENATIRGTTDVVLTLRKDSQSLTPVDTGALRSNVSSDVKKFGKILVGIVSYFMKYAVYVHERTDLRHTVGKAKFLETAVFNMSNNMLKIISLYINRALK